MAHNPAVASPFSEFLLNPTLHPWLHRCSSAAVTPPSLNSLAQSVLSLSCCVVHSNYELTLHLLHWLLFPAGQNLLWFIFIWSCHGVHARWFFFFSPTWFVCLLVYKENLFIIKYLFEKQTSAKNKQIEMPNSTSRDNYS